MGRPLKCTDTDKFCPGCNQRKLHVEFYYNTENPKRPRGYCKECTSKRGKAYRTSAHYNDSPRNQRIEKRRAKSRKATEARRRYRELNPDWLRWELIEKKYGLTKQAWRTILEEQDGVCAICHNAFIGKEPFVDHDHATSMVRGLLCKRCNMALGLARENRQILLGMVDYLDTHKDRGWSQDTDGL